MPIIKDTYIGMIVSASDPKKTEGFVQKNLIAFCYGAFKPSKKTIEKYIAKVEELRNKEEITEKQYFMLKNHSSVEDLIAQKTLGFSEEITDHTIFEVYDGIIDEETKEIIKEKDLELVEMEEKHKLEIEKIEEKHKIEIDEMSDKNLEDTEIFYKEKVEIAQKEFDGFKLKFKFYYSLGIIIFLAALILKFIYIDIKVSKSVFNFILTSFLLLISIASILDLFAFGKIFRYFSKKKIDKLVIKYSLKDNETFE